jgi:choline dehydrogenase-like flavoprotein
MHHRGELDLKDIDDYMRLAEIPPYWREKLTTISWDLPNRIELRMMARYGLVDKAFLLEILKKVGLHEDYRSIAADMMLVMGIQSDLSTRYSKGWIASDDIKSELAAAGLDPKIQERVYQWIVKQSATERVTTEKNLTKAEIVKGVKKGTITRTEGEGLIVDMGYDAKEAKFIMDINIPPEETLSEIKQRELTKSDIINAYKLGEIDEATVVSGLMSIRFSEDNAIFLLNLTNATLAKIEEVKEKSLTKADIIKGVKNSVISQEEGYLMLLTIGYSDEDSIFILSVNPTVPAGSPDSYNEFLALTQSYRGSVGMTTKEVTLNIIQAERDVKAVEAALRYAKDMKAKAKRIKELELALEQAKQLYHQLATVPESKA